MELTKYELVEIEKINNIDLKDDEIVYDFQVKDDNSYNVEGIVVHNSVCITKNKTGVSRPMASCIQDCSSVSEVPIIADGGIVEHGDIAKAIACGCFCGDEEVITKYGKKQIQNIKINDEVYTHSGKLQKVKKKLQKTYNDKLMKINGIKTTPNHEFYVIHKNNIDKLNNNNLDKYAKWISASELTKEYFLIRLEKQ